MTHRDMHTRAADSRDGSVVARARRRSAAKHRTPLAIASIASLCVLGGCIERTIRITSEPPGALVYVNDLEVGRTPTEVAFEYYGTYDVRLVKDGYETWTGPAYTPVPLYDYPVIDLFAELAPVRFTTEIDWHFDLDPVRLDATAMVDRAAQLRARMEAEVPLPEAAGGSPLPADVPAGPATPASNDRALPVEQ